jgi:hypothetical protein
MKKVGHLPRVEPGERESAPRQSGVTPNLVLLSGFQKGRDIKAS